MLSKILSKVLTIFSTISWKCKLDVKTMFVCQRRLRAQPQERAHVTRMARFSEGESENPR